MGAVASTLMRISKTAVSFEVRGFRGQNEPIRPHLEGVGGAFVDGYNRALEIDDLGRLEEVLEAQLPRPLTGFGYEGATMAVALADWAFPWRRPRLRRFVEGPAARHIYLAYVGIGWAIARWPFGRNRRLARLDPLMRWLAYDGIGFHEAFFRTAKTVERHEIPRWVEGYGRRAFDQGLGRSLWFVEGAGAERIPARIAGFPAERRADLWSGVGLACAYAGGVGDEALDALAKSAGPYRAEMAQGVVFAVRARVQAGNPTTDLVRAARRVCGLGVDEAERLAVEAGLDLPTEGPVPGYEVWRARLHDWYRKEKGVDRWTRSCVSSAATA